MAPTAQLKPSLISAALFGTSAIVWWFLERYAQQRFDSGTLPNYDMKIESLSDLGVNYRQVHPLKHHNVHSHAHDAINYDLFIAGTCYGMAQLDLLRSSRSTVTRKRAFARSIRFVLSLLCAMGFFLMGAIHGGPREKFWGTIGWHWNGYGMVAVAGNLVSILAALVPAIGPYERFVPYRLSSLGLGVAGLYCYYRFWTIGEWDFKSPLGLWQRGSVYPILVWQGLTAVTLVYASVLGESKRKSV